MFLTASIKYGNTDGSNNICELAEFITLFIIHNFTSGSNNGFLKSSDSIYS